MDSGPHGRCFGAAEGPLTLEKHQVGVGFFGELDFMGVGFYFRICLLVMESDFQPGGPFCLI